MLIPLYKRCLGTIRHCRSMSRIGIPLLAVLFLLLFTVSGIAGQDTNTSSTESTTSDAGTTSATDETTSASETSDTSETTDAGSTSETTVSSDTSETTVSSDTSETTGASDTSETTGASDTSDTTVDSGVANALCEGGTIPTEETDEFLAEINKIRETVLSGQQPHGDPSEMLPPAKTMSPLNWSCTLEKEALENLKKEDTCPESLTTTPTKAYFYHRSTESSETISKALSQKLTTWSKSKLEVAFEEKATNVKFNGEKDLEAYANLIRETAKEVGCARHKCVPKDQQGVTYNLMLCLTDQTPPAQGDTLYSGPANGCPETAGMTNDVRKQILNSHNGFRSQLAIGTTSKGSNGMCRPAVQMPELVYDCKLEKTAYEQAKKCTAGSATSLTENTATIMKTQVPLKRAAKLAIQLWWAERTNLPATFCQTRNIYTTLMNANHFAKVASEQTVKVGCGIHNCTSKISVVCQYEAPLTSGQTLYKMGTKKAYCRCPQSTCAASFPGLCKTTVTDGVTLY